METQERCQQLQESTYLNLHRIQIPVMQQQ